MPPGTERGWRREPLLVTVVEDARPVGTSGVDVENLLIARVAPKDEQKGKSP